MKKTIGIIFVTALATTAANAQSVKTLDQHKVDIYVAEIRTIQDGAGTLAQKQTQLSSNLNFTGACSLEREFLYGLTGESVLQSDASNLRHHYKLLSQAMERVGLLDASQSEMDFETTKPGVKALIQDVYTKGYQGTDEQAKAGMLRFSETCRDVTLTARNVDALALTRQQGK